MSGKKFFFEEDAPKAEVKPSTGGGFFDALKQTGIVHEQPANFDAALERAKNTEDKSGTMGVELEAEMKVIENQLVRIEYGVYQKNYAIHITPVNDKKNLRTDDQVKRAIEETAKILNSTVPYTMRVNIFMPRPDWKKKVISFVIENAASTWNFDQKKVESRIPDIHQAIQLVITKG